MGRATRRIQLWLALRRLLPTSLLRSWRRFRQRPRSGAAAHRVGGTRRLYGHSQGLTLQLDALEFPCQVRDEFCPPGNNARIEGAKSLSSRVLLANTFDKGGYRQHRAQSRGPTLLKLHRPYLGHFSGLPTNRQSGLLPCSRPTGNDLAASALIPS